MKLVVSNNLPYHVSLETVKDFEELILQDADVAKLELRGNSLKLAQRFVRQAYRYDLGASRLLRPVETLATEGTEEMLVIMMGLQFEKCWPAFKKASKRHLYLFDAWPSVHTRLEQFIRQHQIDTLFVSSLQVADTLSKRLLATKVCYIPEGVKIAKYCWMPFEEKDIDVLHLGRRFEKYHEDLAGPLQAQGIAYLFEKRKGQLLFPTEEGLVDAMARTKVSICVPASTTHPVKAGGVATMTQRFLQTMLAKAIPLGLCPDELKTLFGYDPIVPIDWADPLGQIQEMLSNPNKYRDLVERNHATVTKGHGWSDRWQQMREQLGMV